MCGVYHSQIKIQTTFRPCHYRYDFLKGREQERAEVVVDRSIGQSVQLQRLVQLGIDDWTLTGKVSRCSQSANLEIAARVSERREMMEELSGGYLADLSACAYCILLPERKCC